MIESDMKDDASATGFRQKLYKALSGSERLEPMRVAFRSVVERQRFNASRIPDLEDRRDHLRQVRELSVGNGGLLELAVSNLEANRFRVRRCRDAPEAVGAVAEEMGDLKLLIKSKTNLAREIGLVRSLEGSGFQVVETDIGDRVLQLREDSSVHPTGPCAHLTRFDIARVLSRHLGRPVEPDPCLLIELIREDILPFIELAEVGLSGVNAIAASEGAVVMVHNEGNLDLVCTMTDKLILLASTEKVYPTIEDAVKMAKLETYYTTGQPVTSFIRVVGGPSKTADIEKQIYYGIHGPGEIVLLLIDNGRGLLMAEGVLRESLFCIGCGSCLLECPVYDVVGPAFGSAGHLGGVGACVSAGIEGAKGPRAAIENGLALCTTCGGCTERCPVSLNTPALIEELRARAVTEGLMPLDEHRPLISSMSNYGNPFLQPRATRGKWARALFSDKPGQASAIFFAGCSLSYLTPGVARASVELLRAAGIEPLYLGNQELCCGGPLLRLGETKKFDELAAKNIERFWSTGLTDIITSCPGCLKALNDYAARYPDFPFFVKHITQVLSEAVDRGLLTMKSPSPIKATYHDPCHLGRGAGLYEEPRRLLQAIEGIQLLEMDRNRESAACCGSGGGVKSAFPELALRIAAARARMAEETGADLLVTCCPWCEQNLKEVTAVGNLIELAASRLVRKEGRD